MFTLRGISKFERMTLLLAGYVGVAMFSFDLFYYGIVPFLIVLIMQSVKVVAVVALFGGIVVLKVMRLFFRYTLWYRRLRLLFAKKVSFKIKRSNFYRNWKWYFVGLWKCSH